MKSYSKVKSTFSRPLTMADLMGDCEIDISKNYNQKSNNNSKNKNFFSASSKCKP